MFYLIKSKNIFEQFYKNVYTIEYQKYDLPHMHLLNFLHPNNQFLEASHINEIICTKFSNFKTDLSRELIRIMTLIIVNKPYRDINPHFPFMSNAKDGPLKCIKRYFYKFFERTIIQKNDYLLYWQYNNNYNY